MVICSINAGCARAQAVQLLSFWGRGDGVQADAPRGNRLTNPLGIDARLELHAISDLCREGGGWRLISGIQENAWTYLARSAIKPGGLLFGSI